MASFRGHLAFASATGFVYGGIGASQFQIEPTSAMLGAGLTTIGGLMPDLDSSSGVPIRELFGLASTVIPLIVMKRLSGANLSHEEVLLVMIISYVIIRYGFSRIFKKMTTHRGMFHSIPAMLIAGLLTFLAYDSSSLNIRYFFALAVALGFFSHLLLDEIYSVDFNGIRIRLAKSAGSAIKFYSSCWWASLLTYMLLGWLAFLAYRDINIILGRWYQPS